MDERLRELGAGEKPVIRIRVNRAPRLQYGMPIAIADDQELREDTVVCHTDCGCDLPCPNEAAIELVRGKTLQLEVNVMTEPFCSIVVIS